MSYSSPQLFELSKKVARPWRTPQYWAGQGCGLNDPESLKRFLAEKNRKQPTSKSFVNAAGCPGLSPAARVQEPGAFGPQGNAQAAALGRGRRAMGSGAVGTTTGRMFRWLQSASQGGDRFEVDACQTYWLKSKLPNPVTTGSQAQGMAIPSPAQAQVLDADFDVCPSWMVALFESSQMQENLGGIFEPAVAKNSSQPDQIAHQAAHEAGTDRTFFLRAGPTASQHIGFVIILRNELHFDFTTD
jgi:hypothetical protein